MTGDCGEGGGGIPPRPLLFAQPSLSPAGHKSINQQGWWGDSAWGISQGNQLMTHQDQQRGACKCQAGGAGTVQQRQRRMVGLVLVLVLGLLASATAQRSSLQQQALDLLLEDFHSRRTVQAAFKEQAVIEALETEFPMGTFVQLEVHLVQTVCRKQQRETQDCRIKPGGRKQTCLACFKFDSSNPANVLDKALRCLSEQNPIFQEVKRRQEQECEAVRRANEGNYQPGVFAFSKGLPVPSG